MARTFFQQRLGTLLLLAIAGLYIQPASALVQTYCSSQNTGSGSSAQNSLYQSNGRCHDACIANYAFAIVQGENCWCSNYTPYDQQSTSKCSDPCPGYPDESCGSTSAGLFGYIALDKKPSGTSGAPSSTAKPSVSTTVTPSTTRLSPAILVSSSSPVIPLSRIPTSSAGRDSSSTPRMKTVVNPVDVEYTVTNGVSFTMFNVPTTALPSAAASMTSDPPSSTPKSTWTPTPVTNVQVVTLSGSVITQTVTTTPTAPSNAYLGKAKTSKIAPGYIAAAVIASVAGILLLCLALFWFWRRRQIEDNEKFADPATPPDMQRNFSVHSKAGLLDNKNFPPIITTRFSSHNLDFPATEAISPVSPVSERRNSKPLIYDQRLNPRALMVNDNGSHTSLRTLEDHRDYGRMLKVMNPDENVEERRSFS